ncbi:hypothetical protein MTO96_008944 [Rhipicephalus appendiculatus]
MVVLGLIVFLQAHEEVPRDRFCTTKGCEEHKNLIETQLDKSVDPCDDFWCSRLRGLGISQEVSALTLPDD